jgi:hypothetical protein
MQRQGVDLKEFLNTEYYQAYHLGKLLLKEEGIKTRDWGVRDAAKVARGAVAGVAAAAQWRPGRGGSGGGARTGAEAYYDHIGAPEGSETTYRPLRDRVTNTGSGYDVTNRLETAADLARGVRDALRPGHLVGKAAHAAGNAAKGAARDLKNKLVGESVTVARTREEAKEDWAEHQAAQSENAVPTTATPPERSQVAYSDDTRQAHDKKYLQRLGGSVAKDADRVVTTYDRGEHAMPGLASQVFAAVTVQGAAPNATAEERQAARRALSNIHYEGEMRDHLHRHIKALLQNRAPAWAIELAVAVVNRNGASVAPVDRLRRAAAGDIKEQLADYKAEMLQAVDKAVANRSGGRAWHLKNDPVFRCLAECLVAETAGFTVDQPSPTAGVYAARIRYQYAQVPKSRQHIIPAWARPLIEDATGYLKMQGIGDGTVKKVATAANIIPS